VGAEDLARGPPPVLAGSARDGDPRREEFKS